MFVSAANFFQFKIKNISTISFKQSLQLIKTLNKNVELQISCEALKYGYTMHECEFRMQAHVRLVITGNRDTKPEFYSIITSTVGCMT